MQTIRALLVLSTLTTAAVVQAPGAVTKVVGDAELARVASLDDPPTRIRAVGISDAGLAAVRGLRELTLLDLGNCEKVTDAGLESLAQLQKLEHLSLWGCTQLTDGGLGHLVELDSMRKLWIVRIPAVTDRGIAQLAGVRPLES